MSQKHYNAEYLVDTANILKEIKLKSYQSFAHLESGTIADIGCGVGADVLMMHQLLNKSLKIIGVDHDAALIDIAKKNSSGNESVNFFVSEVAALPFEENTIDGLRAERLIQHIANPIPVFNDAFRVLKSKSVFTVIETDWSNLSFYNGDEKLNNKIVAYLSNQKVVNGFASRKILSYFEEAGFENPVCAVYPLISNKLQDAFTYLWIDKIIHEMAEINLLTEDEKNMVLKGFESADQKQSFICSMNIVIASAQKP